jgi:chemotaxis protein histidine kinase CheA
MQDTQTIYYNTNIAIKKDFFVMASFVPQNLMDNYKNSIPKKIKDLQLLIDNLRNSISEEGLKALRMEVHKIRGNAGSYGFMPVTEICASFENVLLEKIANFKDAPVDQNVITEFDLYLKQIKEAFSRQ